MRPTKSSNPTPFPGSDSTGRAAPLGIYAETYSTSTTARVCGELAESAAPRRVGVDDRAAITPAGGKPGASSRRSPATQRSEATRGAAVDSTTGEVLDFPADSRSVRAERFALKSAAMRLLPKDHRTTKCMRWHVPNQQTQVHKGATTNRAFFTGLQVCSMPWTCPVCASKISERRRHEVARAIKQAKALGLAVRLVTLTVPHGMGDDVADIADRMTKAWTRLWPLAPCVTLSLIHI